MIGLNTNRLQPHRLGTVPTVFVVPEYISGAEEASLLRETTGAKARWTQVSGRRLQNYGGSVTAKGLVPARLPPWLQVLGEHMAEDTAIFGGESGSGPAMPNHVLVNAYQPGEGIMAHEDGPAYHPGVCILSLGGSAVMRFHQKVAGAAPQLAMSVVLPGRSLLVFRDAAYSSHLHGIDPVHEDSIDKTVVNPAAAAAISRNSEQILPARLSRERERVSLTFRRVERVIRGLRL